MLNRVSGRVTFLFVFLTWLGAFGVLCPNDGVVVAQTLVQQLAAEDGAQLSQSVVRLGDVRRGAAIFYRPDLSCARCHESENGRRLGPDLAEKRQVTTDHLIQSILQPSAVIREGYSQQMFQMVDGRQLAGIVVEESEDQILLDRIEEPGKPLAIAVEDIEQRKVMTESSMPVGLVNLLNNRQEFLDLVRFLAEISEAGPARAAQLRPAHALTTLPPLPQYEQELDHQRLINDRSDVVLKQGEEIYQLICSTCHGNKQQEGSMPTSLRFATGKFKRASDPYSMYLTLTHGYGLMLPQRSLVPRQKYAVIHYIRETYLKADNPSQYFQVDSQYLAGLPKGDNIGPEPVLPKPWTEMDYGPSFFNTVEVPGDQSGRGPNIAQKGLTVRLDPGAGGVAAGQQWILYDHDTMRMAAIWRGEFLDFNGIHFNGVHGRHPKITGQILFRTPDQAGWAGPENDYDAPRVLGRDGRNFGPIPRSWAQYHGMYCFGDRSILSYSVHGVPIEESPELVSTDGQQLVVRNLHIGPRTQPLTLRVAESPSGAALQDGVWTLAPVAKPASHRGFAGDRFFQNALSDDWQSKLKMGWIVSARVRTTADGTILAMTEDQEEWLPNGTTLFLRGGRLAWDMGWVGAVAGRREINDGKWHDVEMHWNAENGKVQLRVDGQDDGSGTLKLKGMLQRPVLRVGYTQRNFPAKSAFEGEIETVELRTVAGDPVIKWQPSDHQWEERALGTPLQQQPWKFVTSRGWDGASLRLEKGMLEYVIPAGDSVDLQLVLGHSEEETSNDKIGQACQDLPKPQWERWKQGGVSNWPTVSSGVISETERSGGFVNETIGMPESNPGKCRMRLTGIDFIPDSEDAMVCAWDGSVWKVSGIHGKAGDTVTWRRVAAGLFQPLGIKYRDGQLFVICRDQLVRLHDRNQDGEMDWYECFNNDHQVTEHFHEFAMGLQIDQEGNFYYAKSARHALPALVPHHGTLLKISADGQTTEIIANGFRAANGVCLNPDGSFVVTDQEGHWNPKNRINWVQPGQFYGNMFGYHDVTDSSDEAMSAPLCWITNEFDRSPAELLWVDSEAWGPLNGKLLNLSYGYGKAYIVPFEEVNGQKQGGMCAFDISAFPTGVMRGRFHPGDGHLYCCGMFAWSSTQEKPGGLYRLRASGDPFHLPTELTTAEGEVNVTFSEPLDPESVSIDNFAIQAWDLKRTANYGSQHYRQRTWEVSKVALSEDRRTVTLSIPELEPTWGMEIAFSLRDQNGQEFRNRIHNSIFQLKAK